MEKFNLNHSQKQNKFLRKMELNKPIHSALYFTSDKKDIHAYCKNK